MDDQNEISVHFDGNKDQFLRGLELLSLGARLCHETGYDRGAVECLNMFIRACSNVQDMRMMRYAY
jgi:hypothetical protein